MLPNIKEAIIWRCSSIAATVRNANVPKPATNMWEFWNKWATEESDENPVQLSFMNERYATGPAGSAVCSIGTSVLSLK